jgi:hypothetical protein
MPDPSLFHGIAVLIDDEIQDERASIRAIQSQIEAEGCHVVTMSKLPTQASVPNLREVAFFILDWNLYGRSLRETAGDGPIVVPQGLKEQNAADAIKFLKDLKSIRFAPVFIFTDELVEEITDELKKDKDLYDEQDPSHILVMSKGEVQAKGIFSVLSTWMQSAPSVYVLKRWERAYQVAKNALFVDFYAKSVLWPLYLWKTYQEDDVSASMELGSVIGRNLLSRMAPFDFDLAPFADALKSADADEGKSRDILLKVLEGDRFVSKEQLHGDSIAPGDVFKKSKEFFINIRPDCDCIPRGGSDPDSVKLYLLKGDKLSSGQVTKRHREKYGSIEEDDSEAVVFAMKDGISVSFQLAELYIETWGDWKALRIGRLLPPFLTRLQQRYSAYLQRPGLTRVPKAAVPLASPVLAIAQAEAKEANGTTDVVSKEGSVKDQGESSPTAALDSDKNKTA